MADPTIPRHSRRRPRALTSGWFVDYGDRRVLRDRWGNTWAEESVSIVQGGFGYAEDGAQKLPRPFRYDPITGKTVIEGDVVLIDFIDQNPKLPVVMGGVRSARETGYLDRGYADAEAPYNRLAARLRALDTAGNVTGEMRLDVHGDDGDGAAKLATTTRIELLVSPDLDTEATPIRVTIEGGKVTVEGGGLTEPVLLGRTYTADEAGAVSGIATVLSGLGFPVPPAVAFAANLVLASTVGAPYLSQRLEAE